MEPKDRDLRAELKATQAAVYDAIERVVVLRSTVPARLAGTAGVWEAAAVAETAAPLPTAAPLTEEAAVDGANSHHVPCAPPPAPVHLPFLPRHTGASGPAVEKLARTMARFSQLKMVGSVLACVLVLC